MTQVLLLGAGKIGSMICHLLHATGEYTVTVADRDEACLRHVAHDEAALRTLDVADPDALRAALKGHDVVISDRKSTRLNSSHRMPSRMPSSA